MLSDGVEASQPGRSNRTQSNQAVIQEMHDSPHPKMFIDIDFMQLKMTLTSSQS